ncbi:MAG TPA: hypothetical protein VFX61_00315 [Micromonosporaceae bacterium]|nr:hypothetical protein [Micromonosporaceae bacterium]
MDALDHLAGPAADLLRRVDDLLAEAGAPDTHRIWPLLHRLRLLPGAAVEAIVALRPGPLPAASAGLRTLIDRYGEAAATLDTEVEWAGGAAELFAAHRAALAEHLTGGPESLAGRLGESLSFLESTGEWISAGRAALARTLAAVLTSAEAVAVVIGPGAAPPAGAGEFSVATVALTAPAAAAEIGARVLATVAEIHDRGETIRQRWSPDLAEVATFRAPPPTVSRLDGTTRLVF